MLTTAMFNIQLHNWLISDESIVVPHSAPSSSGWLTIDESALPPPQVLDDLCAPLLRDLWGPLFL